MSERQAEKTESCLSILYDAPHTTAAHSMHIQHYCVFMASSLLCSLTTPSPVTGENDSLDHIAEVLCAFIDCVVFFKPASHLLDSGTLR